MSSVVVSEDRRVKDGWSEGRPERSDSKSNILPNHIIITFHSWLRSSPLANPLLVASHLAPPPPHLYKGLDNPPLHSAVHVQPSHQHHRLVLVRYDLRGESVVLVAIRYHGGPKPEVVIYHHHWTELLG